VGLCGLIRLWSLTLRSVRWMGSPTEALQAFPGNYVFERRSSLAHLGNSHCRASGTDNNPILPPT
jgi:hypothetical protein